MERIAIIKTKIFWKFFLPYLVIFISFLIAALYVFENHIKPFTHFHSGQIVTAQFYSLEHLAQDFLLNPDDVTKKQRIEKMSEKLGTTVAVYQTNSQRLLLAKGAEYLNRDSSFDKELLSLNIDTFTGGLSPYRSDSGNEFLQYSRKIDDKGTHVGFLRVYLPMEQTINTLNTIRNSMLGIFLIGGLLSLGLGYRRSRNFTRPIYEMKEVCSGLQKGEYDQKVVSLPRDELGKLGQTLNQLAHEITSKIDTISFERAQLKTLLASMVEGIVSIDENNTLQFCNSAAYNLLGSDIIDGRYHNIESLKGFNLLSDLVEKAKRTQVLVEEEIIIGEKGNSKTLECYASTFKTGEDSGMIIVLHNVTEIRHLERVRRDFVANASHEIKTPLTNIKGYAETLLAGALSDGKMSEKFVEKISNNALRLSHLVQDLLSLARIESQEEGLRIIPTNWYQIVNQGLARYEDVIKEKKLSVFLDNPSLQSTLLGDNDAMAQIFDNLLTNAIRYTPENGEIRISGKNIDKFAILNIEDNGIGISKKNLERVFERFYRVDKARSRELGGTGLGLAIVKHLVTNMNGKVYVTSEVGMGSKFSIALRTP